MSAMVVAGAIALDIIIGEPPIPLHPVVWIGKFTSWYRRILPPKGVPRDLLTGGLLVLLLGTLAVVPCTFVQNPILEALLLSTTFSHRYFHETLKNLANIFSRGTLDSQRAAMGELVSRDTSPLSQTELLGAAIETAFENITDSIAAPLLFYVLGGLEAAMLYRVMNTLDAMIGYRDRYFYYGKIPARLDDLFNFIPSRIVAALLLAAGALQKLPVKDAWRIFRRDRNNTDSPNAGQTMSMAAGLLGLQLSKRECYLLGDPVRELSPAVFAESLRLWKATVWFALALCLLLTVAVRGVFG